MALIQITEGASLVFINILILAGLVVGFYCSQKIERKRAKDVITAATGLTSAVADMVIVMKKNMHQNEINFAVNRARTEEEIIID